MYLLFQTKEQADIASNKIYINYIKKTINNSEFFDGYLYNVITKEKVLFESITDEDLLYYSIDNREYPILGTRLGRLDKEQGYTTAYTISAEIQSGELQGKYYLTKPEDLDLLVGITDYIEIEELGLIDTQGDI